MAGSTLTRERGVNPRQLVIHLQHLEELLQNRCGHGGVRRSALEPASCAGLRRGPVVPAPQLAVAFEPRARQEPGPEGSVLKLYWSEMSKRLHALGMDVLGAASPLWRGADFEPGGRFVADVRGSTTRRRRSSPARTRSSGASSASGCSACRVSLRARRRAIAPGDGRRQGRCEASWVGPAGRRSRRSDPMTTDEPGRRRTGSRGTGRSVRGGRCCGHDHSEPARMRRTLRAWR